MTMPMQVQQDHADHATVRFAAPKSASGTILLIEDDVRLARSLIRVMNAEGYSVVHVATGAAAVENVMSRSFDLIISDLNLPGTSGVDVLNVVRAYDPDVPLVLMTGTPTIDTAIEAVSLGVLEYLVKPTPRDQLVRVLGRATKARRSAAHHREATNHEKATADTVRPPARAKAISAMQAVTAQTVALASPVDSGSPLSVSFERALASLAVRLEPVAHATTKKLIGFAARMSSSEDILSSESALVIAAEQLDRLEELRRRVRDLAVKEFAAAPPDALLFIDVHPSDLLEGDLYSPEPPLARIAERVVLQVRARGLAIHDLSARASVLRFVGFRLAVAELDAGQECLSQIVDLAPDFVKIDGRLVRGLDRCSGRRRVVSALISMCRTLDAVSIAEGVSTAEECEALATAGCAMVQGSLLLRHSL
jgi:EAL domain-containing protein (putative c-di-GMP-specific phosphodiesterase class I)/CheY-like chemotaxis protein